MPHFFISILAEGHPIRAQLAMPTVFATMAGANALILIGTAVLGLLAETVHPERHILLALFTLIITCLVQTVFFMYFAVTGKLMIQAVGLSDLDNAPLVRSRELKNRAMRWLGVVVTAAVVTGITGAARWHSAAAHDGSYLHILTASLAVGTMFVGFYQEYNLTVLHSTLLSGVLAEYTRLRAEGDRAGDGPALTEAGGDRAEDSPALTKGEHPDNA